MTFVCKQCDHAFPEHAVRREWSGNVCEYICTPCFDEQVEIANEIITEIIEEENV